MMIERIRPWVQGKGPDPWIWQRGKIYLECTEKAGLLLFRRCGRYGRTEGKAGGDQKLDCRTGLSEMFK